MGQARRRKSTTRLALHASAGGTVVCSTPDVALLAFAGLEDLILSIAILFCRRQLSRAFMDLQLTVCLCFPPSVGLVSGSIHAPYM